MQHAPAMSGSTSSAPNFRGELACWLITCARAHLPVSARPGPPGGERRLPRLRIASAPGGQVQIGSIPTPSVFACALSRLQHPIPRFDLPPLPAFPTPPTTYIQPLWPVGPAPLSLAFSCPMPYCPTPPA